jgi:hypothetical protein
VKLRHVLPAVLLTGALAAPAPAAAFTSPGATASVLFGGTLPLMAKEGALGVTLGVVRMYWTLPHLGTGTALKVIAGHRAVLASIDVPRGGPSYARIAAGAEDKTVLPFLRALAAASASARVPLFVAFQHEADSPHDQALGTPARFTAAWDHLHALAARARLNAAQGGPVRWALILMHWAYVPYGDPARPRWSHYLGWAGDYWPGAGEVDYAAADGYDRGGCMLSASDVPLLPAVSPQYLFGPAATFAAHHGVPLIVAEWGANWYPRDPSFQTAFIGQMRSWVTANAGSLAAVSYFDTPDRSSGYCNSPVDGHPASMSALARVARAMP